MTKEQHNMEFVMILLLFHVCFFCHEACGSELPDHVLNLHALHWKVKS